MNRNLAYFSIFLILIGAGTGVYLISLMGTILLVPALVSSTSLPRPRTPEPARAPPRRIIPPTPAPSPMSTPEAQSMAAAPVITPMQYQGFTGPLFAAPMFPSLSQMGAPPPAASEPPPVSQGRDELLEVGAILAVLKLLAG